MKITVKQKELDIHNYYIFIVFFTLVKIVLMGCFSSDYQNKLFIPFLSWFASNGGNPYQHFYETGIRNAFPYPPVMLWIESLSAFAVRFFQIESVFMTNFIYKLPSLVFDFIGLHLLVKQFPLKRKYAAVFWFASPITLYAVYMHGQLDLIPTVLLFASVYYLSSREKNRDVKGCCLLALALLSKLHILAVLPVVFMYLHKRENVKKMFLFGMAAAVAVLLGMAVYFSDGFVSMVLLNEEQSTITQVALGFSSVEIYASVAAVVILYLATFNTNIINRNLFLSLCGMVFAIFLAFCPPMPGWYVWIVPYVTMFFVNVDLEKYKNIIVYMLLNILYLLYFVFFHQRKLVDLYFMQWDLSFLKTDSTLLKNLVFTVLSSVLVYIIYSMYKLGIASNSLYRRRNVPFMIGIAGDSGAGKSTLLTLLEKCFGSTNILYIEGDGDHRWERGEKHWEEFTHLNPKANYLYRQAQDLRLLKTGNAVKRVEYDHDTGMFTKAKRINPRDYVVLCGLHSLYLPQTRRYFDLKIYMDADENLRRYWKIQRDIEERGYSPEKVLQQIEERMPDAKKYIWPQKDYADMQIRYYDKTLGDCMVKSHDVRMSIRITVSAAVNVEELTDALEAYGVTCSYDYSEDLKKQVVDFDEEVLANAKFPVQSIAEKVIPQLEEITGEKLAYTNGISAVVTLFVLLLVSYKMRNEV